MPQEFSSKLIQQNVPGNLSETNWLKQAPNIYEKYVYNTSQPNTYTQLINTILKFNKILLILNTTIKEN